MNRTVQQLTCICMALLLAPEAVFAFNIFGGRWPQPVIGDPITITYSYNNLLDGGLLDPDGNPLPADFIRASVEEALGVWASHAPLNFVEVRDQGGPVQFGGYPDGQFGQIRFSHRFDDGPDPPACFVPGANPAACGAKPKARAFFPSAIDNAAGDVFYDNGDRWQEFGTLPQPDILGATVHELGHSLGLAHNTIPESNMYWVFQRSQGLGTSALHEDDIAGIQFLYGEGVGSVTPLLIPEPASFLLAAILLLTLPLRWRLRRGV